MQLIKTLTNEALNFYSIQEVLIEKTDGGLDFTFECIGNVHTMVTNSVFFMFKFK